MVALKNITSASAFTTLIAKGGSRPGVFRKINISNNSANSATIDLDLYDGTTAYHICKNVVIPTGAAFSMDGFSFSSKTYSLRIYNTGTSPGLTVMIK